MALLSDSTVAAVPVRRKVVLIVDRDADTRKLYAEYLNMSASCSVDEAEDGREALAKAITRHPDVVVTETRLPGLSGFDLCALLRRDSTTTNIPIIVVTGDAQDADVKRAQRAGADRVLIKPCLPDLLLNEIRRVTTRSGELRHGAQDVAEPISRHAAAANDAVERSPANPKRVMLSRSHDRRSTTEPPIRPPALICPMCDLPLQYLRSHVGGVSVRHPEQWDYFECAGGCGTFQYRERTKKIRKV
jgi:two-component system, cell cycle response regulator DivK